MASSNGGTFKPRALAVYKNGIDMHLDWGASQFLTKQWQVGLVDLTVPQSLLARADEVIDKIAPSHFHPEVQHSDRIGSNTFCRARKNCYPVRQIVFSFGYPD